MDVINHLSLCAGVGGIDIGLRKVVKGLRTLAMVEREAFAISVLESKMEEGALDKCPIYPDLLRFPWERYRGLLDIVSGGFPCQPFSISGSRKSTEDPRHLWPFIKEGIGITKPIFCFFENVDGIASAKSPGYYSVLHHVLSDLEEMGYRTEAGCFSAEEVGAPHQRKRWFILAYGERARLEGHPRHECNESGPTGKSSFSGPTSESGLQRWPARPGEKQKGWEPPRTVKPGLGRYVDGIPNRVDRLRALGNAVVPEVAATAFIHLLKRLEE